MQRRFYEQRSLPDADIEECTMARWRYRQFQTWFQSRYVLVVRGRCYEPMAAFNRSLIEFMVAVCWHKYKFEGVVPQHKNLSQVYVAHVFGRFLCNEYPELFQRWKKLAKAHKTRVFYWSGPKFEVKLRRDGEVLEVLDDFLDDHLNDKEMGETPASADDQPKGGNVQGSQRKRKRKGTTGEFELVICQKLTNGKENSR